MEAGTCSALMWCLASRTQCTPVGAHVAEGHRRSGLRSWSWAHAGRIFAPAVPGQVAIGCALLRERPAGPGRRRTPGCRQPEAQRLLRRPFARKRPFRSRPPVSTTSGIAARMRGSFLNSLLASTNPLRADSLVLVSVMFISLPKAARPSARWMLKGAVKGPDVLA
jgi:hypothetical protein